MSAKPLRYFSKKQKQKWNVFDMCASVEHYLNIQKMVMGIYVLAIIASDKLNNSSEHMHSGKQQKPFNRFMNIYQDFCTL